MTLAVRILITLLTLSFSVASSQVYSQNYVWNQKAGYGGGETYDPFCFVIGTKAYAGTGRALPGTNKNDFWEYDPVSNVWTQKADFQGTGRYGARGFSIGNYGFAGSGWDPSAKKDFYRYDPVTNTWTAIADFGGTARYTSVAFGLGNQGYLGLGYSPCKSDFWQYSPGSNQWAQIASHPNGARQASTAVVHGNYAYVAFGACNASLYNDLYRYDPILNTWSPLAPLPSSGRNSAFGFVIGDSLYFGMGNDYQNNSGPFTIYDDFWRYSISTDTWLQLPDHPGGKRYCGVSFAIGNKGYIGLGSDTTFNTQFLNDFWEYAPSTLGFNEPLQSVTDLSVFPVPAGDYVYIRIPATMTQRDRPEIRIYDISGRRLMVHQPVAGKSPLVVDVRELPSGVYTIVLSVAGKTTGAGRMIRY